MRKALVFTLIIFILAAFVIGYAFAAIDSSCDKLDFAEETLAGDPAYADGLNVEYLLHYDSHNMWKNHLILDSDADGGFRSAHSDFSYSRKEMEDYSTDVDWARLSGYVDRQFTRYSIIYGDSMNDHLPDFIKDYAENMAPDTASDYTFRLKDIYEYYPIFFMASIPGYSYDSSLVWEYEYYMNQYKNGERTGNIPLTEEALNSVKQFAYINEFFKIPVLDDEYAVASVYKDKNGNYDVDITEFYPYDAADTANNELQKDCYYFDIYGIPIENEEESAFYFSVTNRTANGNTVDMSKIPGGYGIYKLPYDYEIVETNSVQIDKGSIDASNLKMVYSLEETSTVEYIGTNTHNNFMILVTREDTGRYMNVIDINDMSTVRRYMLDDSKSDESETTFSCYEGFGYLMVYSNQCGLKIYYENTSGIYEEVFEIPSSKINSGMTNEFGSDMITNFWGYDAFNLIHSFNGEKLVMAVPEWGCSFNKYYYGGANILVCVIDKEGLKYLGRIKCSLDECNYYPETEEDVNNRRITDTYNYNVKYKNFDAIRLRW